MKPYALVAQHLQPPRRGADNGAIANAFALHDNGDARLRTLVGRREHRNAALLLPLTRPISLRKW
eukprot:3507278-Lingulodinium_polyedra.AAC.1